MVHEREDPRNEKTQESIRSRPGLNNRVAIRERAESTGINRWGVDVRPKGFTGKRESGRGPGNGFSIVGLDESSEG